MKLIYSFDFDGTLVENAFPDIGAPIKSIIDFAFKVKKQGHYIILNTMRGGNQLDEALDFCKSMGLEFDAVNDNLPHMKKFYKNNPRKIFANYYIDDHNLLMNEINNPALSFDDIKKMVAEADKNWIGDVHIWLWYKTIGRYVVLYNAYKDSKGKQILVLERIGYLEFQENEFYMMEVKDG
ncbi:MAG: hypothetical protein Q4E81_05490 [Succinatimonas sp.]|nr:hypothetical protein [Succinatimonas sp.]